MSEGSPRHTSVVTVSARDPEGETVNYSIISGNNQGHFSIGESTGVVRVMEELDREETNRYSLVSQGWGRNGCVVKCEANKSST